MAGTILGRDQVEKVNSQYAKIRSHIANLLAGDVSPVAAMRVHVLTEHLDTTELSRIFMELPFLSPAEKRALVRVAIFDALLGKAIPFTDMEAASVHPGVAEIERFHNQIVDNAKIYNPPQFKLNVATVEAHQAPAAAEAASVVTTPTVLTKLNDLRKDAKEKHDTAEAERQEAVAEIRKPDVAPEQVTGFTLNVAKVEDHQGQ